MILYISIMLDLFGIHCLDIYHLLSKQHKTVVRCSSKSYVEFQYTNENIITLQGKPIFSVAFGDSFRVPKTMFLFITYSSPSCQLPACQCDHYGMATVVQIYSSLEKSQQSSSLLHRNCHFMHQPNIKINLFFAFPDRP